MRLLRALLITVGAILGIVVLVPVGLYLAGRILSLPVLGLAAVLVVLVLATLAQWRANVFGARNPWTLPGAGSFGKAYQDRLLREQTERELAAERHS